MKYHASAVIVYLHKLPNRGKSFSTSGTVIFLRMLEVTFESQLSVISIFNLSSTYLTTIVSKISLEFNSTRLTVVKGWGNK
ncbi:hypothetical protein BMF77_03859 [Dolichospermum sp. UHCC 0315A]|jgi:hypothetical protein|nr:hypothetical protein BMF77_03859 [Dolichospermum sp. UHCC 0315A]